MPGNNFLINARRGRNDEFYTQYSDIESEMDKFEKFLRGKVVYCPCDHHEKSNFPLYFRNNFRRLELAGLYISDLYDGVYYFDGQNETNIGGPIDIRGDRFIEHLYKCDVVVTNPPFSLFLKFIDAIIMTKRDYIIIGSQNSITNRYMFEYIKDGKSYVDYGFKGLAGHFIVPEHYEDFASAGDHKEGMIRVSGVVWYTSFNISIDKPFIELSNKSIEDFQTFDNFKEISGLSEDCICVDKVKDIPEGWKGYIGVPITFLEKWNPEQFELVQLDHWGPLGNQDNVVNGETKYRRIYIRLNHVQ